VDTITSGNLNVGPLWSVKMFVTVAGATLCRPPAKYTVSSFTRVSIKIPKKTATLIS